MAKVGLKYPVYAKLTEDELAKTLTYSGGAVMAKLIKADISVTVGDEKLYADDMVAESDRSFSDGTVTVDVDDLYDAAKVDLLGYIEGATVDAGISSKELTAMGDASGAYVGFGFYGKVKRSGASRYRAIWLKKVQFAEPDDSFETKGENVAFQTPTIDGSIMVAVDGTYKDEATFSTEAACKAWLDGKSGIASICATPVSSVASGTYTSAQNVELTTATGSASIYYTDDGTIPSAANGTLYSTPIELAKPSNTCIKAIAVKGGSTSSAILELYITVTN